MAFTTSIRIPNELDVQYETLAQATGRSRNELMIAALRSMAKLQLREIAMIQEGLDQSRAGLGIPIEDVLATFIVEGILVLQRRFKRPRVTIAVHAADGDDA
jgi:predicted transcriptional regulator